MPCLGWKCDTVWLLGICLKVGYTFSCTRPCHILAQTLAHSLNIKILKCTHVTLLDRLCNIIYAHLPFSTCTETCKRVDYYMLAFGSVLKWLITKLPQEGIKQNFILFSRAVYFKILTLISWKLKGLKFT